MPVKYSYVIYEEFYYSMEDEDDDKICAVRMQGVFPFTPKGSEKAYDYAKCKAEAYAERMNATVKCHVNHSADLPVETRFWLEKHPNPDLHNPLMEKFVWVVRKTPNNPKK